MKLTFLLATCFVIPISGILPNYTKQGVKPRPTPGKPIVINTWATHEFELANRKASANLNGGRMYALVSGLSACEALQCDGTVGFGGSPDENGESTLDALLLDSVNHKVAAVANLHRIKDAARVAWAIMNYTMHTMLVGESATAFAKQMGFTEESLATDQSTKLFNNWKSNHCQPNFWQNVSPASNGSCGPYNPLPYHLHTEKSTNQVIDRFHHDTIGMIILDENNHIAAGTSTNGAKYKIPGRVGDSPIPGSGAFVLENVGGAAATGDGDVLMRFMPSLLTVEYMSAGTKPGKAARKSLMRIIGLYPHFQGAVVAVNVMGEYGAACANLNQKFEYVVFSEGKTTINSTECIKPHEAESKITHPKRKKTHKPHNKHD